MLRSSLRKPKELVPEYQYVRLQQFFTTNSKSRSNENSSGFFEREYRLRLVPLRKSVNLNLHQPHYCRRIQVSKSHSAQAARESPRALSSITKPRRQRTDWAFSLPPSPKSDKAKIHISRHRQVGKKVSTNGTCATTQIKANHPSREVPPL